MNRADKIFINMLSVDSTPLGCTDSPYALSKEILQRGLIACQPPIMRHLRNFIQTTNENRMIVWTDKYGNTWAVLNTTRTTLDGSRRIDWVECKAAACMPNYMTSTMNNPIWITTYRQK